MLAASPPMPMPGGCCRRASGRPTGTTGLGRARRQRVQGLSAGRGARPAAAEDSRRRVLLHPAHRPARRHGRPVHRRHRRDADAGGLVSGTIVHRRIFKDFFTLRPQRPARGLARRAQRAGGDRPAVPPDDRLHRPGDLHRLLLQAGLQVVYQNDGERFFHEVQGSYEREEVGRPRAAGVHRRPDRRGRQGLGRRRRRAGSASTIPMTRRPPWTSAGATPRASSTTSARSTSMPPAANCCMPSRPMRPLRTYGWLTGLHMIQWGGQLVRWMYLLLGLSGAMMIFGGLQVWLAKREVRGSRGVGLVRALNLAVCGGLSLASLALLWGNRLLPTQLAGRDTWEIRVFCLSWALVALWAIVRNSGTLGRTQLRLAAVVALGPSCSACCVARKATCWPACSVGDWVLAGVDLSLLGLGLLCAWLGWRRRQASSKPVRRRLNVQEVA
uniref:Hypothetical integral membrane protein n=1 Tax=Pseudomonas aeruginosa TaxID=287 RepID=Q9S1G0_PSEAI|nr:hypothetical integral membrane protein [Pseudomonas aeruginosa]